MSACIAWVLKEKAREAPTKLASLQIGSSMLIRLINSVASILYLRV
jgi:hypothetical protein